MCYQHRDVIVVFVGVSLASNILNYTANDSKLHFLLTTQFYWICLRAQQKENYLLATWIQPRSDHTIIFSNWTCHKFTDIPKSYGWLFICHCIPTTQLYIPMMVAKSVPCFESHPVESPVEWHIKVVIPWNTVSHHSIFH